MAVGVRRSDMEILRDILRMGRGRATLLRSSANLNYAQLQKYLSFLERRNLIALEKHSARTIDFIVTVKGREVLRLLDRLFVTLELESYSDAGNWHEDGGLMQLR